MNKKEALELLAVLKAAYPSSYKNLTKQEATGVVSVWAIQFAKIPADIVHMALQKAISANSYPPSIHDVKQKLQNVYWEAYDALRRDDVMHTALPSERAALERICNIALLYKISEAAEPTVENMLCYARAAGIEHADSISLIGG